MGGKKGFFKAPKIKIATPKITVGKDLGMKNIGKVASNVVKATGKAGEDIGRGVGKGATAAYKTAGDYGSALVKTLGKGTEGIVANAADLGENLAQGDFKGIGKEALELVQSGKDVVKGLSKANAGLATGALGAVGSSLSDKNITGAAKNIEREQNKAVDKYGDAAIDAAISAVPVAGQAYALGKTAAGGLAKGGLSSLTSMKGLQDMAIEAGASKLGIDPNLAKMGMAATSGDLKGAALQGLGSFAGLSPDQMKMASTGLAAVTGDKKGLASGLASQFGAGDSVANMVGAVAGGKKNDMISALGGQLGLDPKMANMLGAVASGKKGDIASALGGQLGLDPKIASTLGAVASGDLKGAALGKIAESTGLSPDILKQVSTGKFDVGELAKNANLTASLGGMAKPYLPGSVSNMVGNAGRMVESANAYKDDIQNQALDQMGRAGLPMDKVKGIQDMKKTAETTYKIAKGDTLGAIAKKMGVDVKALAAANGIKDINKIAAGMNLKMPGTASRSPASEDDTQDLSGNIGAGVVESGQASQAQLDAIQNKGARSSVTDKFLKDASGKTIYGANNAPIPNPSYSSVEADKLQGQNIEDSKGFLDKAGEFLGGVGDKISGAVGAAGKFVDENKNLVATGIQGAAAYGGYKAGEASREEREKLLEKQILETQGVNALKNYQLSKERDTAYGEQQKFLEERIAGGGMTAKEREMQQQGQMKAAKMAAAGRLSGLEQQARLGGVGLGTAGLAGAFAGSQAQANALADSERAAATSAGENLEKAYSARPAALEAKAKSEMELAGLKDTTELSKLGQIGVSRAGLGNIEEGRGLAETKLIREGADLATGTLYDRTVLGSNATDKEREIAAQADVDQKKKEADDKAKADAALAAKANAAGNASGTAPTQGNIQAASTTPTQTSATGKTPPTTAYGQFNEVLTVPYQRPSETPKPQPAPAPAPQPGQGQGYGVLAPTSKPPTAVDNMMNIVKNPTQAIKNPQQALQTVQQVAKNPQAAIDETKKKAEALAKQKAEELKQQGMKAVGGLVPDSIKNVFGMNK